MSSFGGTGRVAAHLSAAHAAAAIGRFVLSYLFYQSAAASSLFAFSSAGHSAEDGGTALCRTILRSSTDKFCGMAPNALEHALLLEDLLCFSPLVLKKHCDGGGNDTHLEGLDERQKEEVVALAIAAHHLPALIDTLANVPGGALPPRVASRAIVPAVQRLLLLQAAGRQGRFFWKKTDTEDHVDHAFLLAKKALFSADVGKREYAASLLVALLGVAAVASATSMAGGGHRGAWSSHLYDMKGCLRRCLTHQGVVRTEAYTFSFRV